jgi:hypothetical protein
MGSIKISLPEKCLAKRPALISQPDIGGVTLHNPDYASWPVRSGLPRRKNCWRRRV